MPDPLLTIRVPRPTRGFAAACLALAALALVRAGAVLDPHVAGPAVGAALDGRAALGALCWAGAGALTTGVGCLLWRGPRATERSFRVLRGGKDDAP